MKIVVDTHTHTLACQHAYSTLGENVREAARKSLELICLTEHGPQLPGSPHPYFFGNIRVVPPMMEGVKILKGMEANILDENGTLDLPMQYLNRMEIILAGLHNSCFKPGSERENTKAIIRTMEKEIVDVIVHSGNPAYPLNYSDVLKAAKDTNTLIEINNSSFVHSRKGSYPNCRLIAEECLKREIKITLGSDAHMACDVGEFGVALELLKDLQFPEELVMNTDVGKLTKYLEKKGRVLFMDPRNEDK
ncbi:phosphatase [Alkalibacter rhizosphaerae]|uniref:Phosphatase n=1 Tax=Alkalibacter rhizosphaerae TaxID=2815577 RepID=A0A974XGL9_9FIRM|nr:phosphatase [Alkalibacter rhizosphaerae]QSX08270.1 phosphatase [Alkalibacter rhizosphaerae]